MVSSISLTKLEASKAIWNILWTEKGPSPHDEDSEIASAANAAASAAMGSSTHHGHAKTQNYIEFDVLDAVLLGDRSGPQEKRKVFSWLFTTSDGLVKQKLKSRWRIESVIQRCMQDPTSLSSLRLSDTKLYCHLFDPRVGRWRVIENADQFHVHCSTTAFSHRAEKSSEDISMSLSVSVDKPDQQLKDQQPQPEHRHASIAPSPKAQVSTITSGNPTALVTFAHLREPQKVKYLEIVYEIVPDSKNTVSHKVAVYSLISSRAVGMHKDAAAAALSGAGVVSPAGKSDKSGQKRAKSSSKSSPKYLSSQLNTVDELLQYSDKPGGAIEHSYLPTERILCKSKFLTAQSKAFVLRLVKLMEARMRMSHLLEDSENYSQLGSPTGSLSASRAAAAGGGGREGMYAGSVGQQQHHHHDHHRISDRVRIDKLSIVVMLESNYDLLLKVSGALHGAKGAHRVNDAATANEMTSKMDIEDRKFWFHHANSIVIARYGSSNVLADQVLGKKEVDGGSRAYSADERDGGSPCSGLSAGARGMHGVSHYANSSSRSINSLCSSISTHNSVSALKDMFLYGNVSAHALGSGSVGLIHSGPGSSLTGGGSTVGNGVAYTIDAQGTRKPTRCNGDFCNFVSDRGSELPPGFDIDDDDERLSHFNIKNETKKAVLRHRRVNQKPQQQQQQNQSKKRKNAGAGNDLRDEDDEERENNMAMISEEPLDLEDALYGHSAGNSFGTAGASVHTRVLQVSHRDQLGLHSALPGGGAGSIAAGGAHSKTGTGGSIMGEGDKGNGFKGLLDSSTSNPYAVLMTEFKNQVHPLAMTTKNLRVSMKSIVLARKEMEEIDQYEQYEHPHPVISSPLSGKHVSGVDGSSIGEKVEKEYDEEEDAFKMTKESTIWPPKLRKWYATTGRNFLRARPNNIPLPISSGHKIGQAVLASKAHNTASSSSLIHHKYGENDTKTTTGMLRSSSSLQPTGGSVGSIGSSSRNGNNSDKIGAISGGEALLLSPNPKSKLTRGKTAVHIVNSVLSDSNFNTTNTHQTQSNPLQNLPPLGRKSDHDFALLAHHHPAVEYSDESSVYGTGNRTVGGAVGQLNWYYSPMRVCERCYRVYSELDQRRKSRERAQLKTQKEVLQHARQENGDNTDEREDWRKNEQRIFEQKKFVHRLATETLGIAENAASDVHTSDEGGRAYTKSAGGMDGHNALRGAEKNKARKAKRLTGTGSTYGGLGKGGPKTLPPMPWNLAEADQRAKYEQTLNSFSVRNIVRKNTEEMRMLAAALDRNNAAILFSEPYPPTSTHIPHHQRLTPLQEKNSVSEGSILKGSPTENHNNNNKSGQNHPNPLEVEAKPSDNFSATDRITAAWDEFVRSGGERGGARGGVGRAGMHRLDPFALSNALTDGGEQQQQQQQQQPGEGQDEGAEVTVDGNGDVQSTVTQDGTKSVKSKKKGTMGPRLGANPDRLLHPWQRDLQRMKEEQAAARQKEQQQEAEEREGFKNGKTKKRTKNHKGKIPTVTAHGTAGDNAVSREHNNSNSEHLNVEIEQALEEAKSRRASGELSDDSEIEFLEQMLAKFRQLPTLNEPSFSLNVRPEELGLFSSSSLSSPPRAGADQQAKHIIVNNNKSNKNNKNNNIDNNQSGVVSERRGNNGSSAAGGSSNKHFISLMHSSLLLNDPERIPTTTTTTSTTTRTAEGDDYKRNNCRRRVGHDKQAGEGEREEVREEQERREEEDDTDDDHSSVLTSLSDAYSRSDASKVRELRAREGDLSTRRENENESKQERDRELEPEGKRGKEVRISENGNKEKGKGKGKSQHEKREEASQEPVQTTTAAAAVVVNSARDKDSMTTTPTLVPLKTGPAVMHGKEMTGKEGEEEEEEEEVEMDGDDRDLVFLHGGAVKTTTTTKNKKKMDEKDNVSGFSAQSELHINTTTSASHSTDDASLKHSTSGAAVEAGSSSNSSSNNGTPSSSQRKKPSLKGAMTVPLAVARFKKASPLRKAFLLPQSSADPDAIAREAAAKHSAELFGTDRLFGGGAGPGTGAGPTIGVTSIGVSTMPAVAATAATTTTTTTAATAAGGGGGEGSSSISGGGSSSISIISSNSAANIVNATKKLVIPLSKEKEGNDRSNVAGKGLGREIEVDEETEEGKDIDIDMNQKDIDKYSETGSGSGSSAVGKQRVPKDLRTVDREGDSTKYLPGDGRAVFSRRARTPSPSQPSLPSSVEESGKMVQKIMPMGEKSQDLDGKLIGAAVADAAGSGSGVDRGGGVSENWGNASRVGEITERPLFDFGSSRKKGGFLPPSHSLSSRSNAGFRGVPNSGANASVFGDIGHGIGGVGIDGQAGEAGRGGGGGRARGALDSIESGSQRSGMDTSAASSASTSSSNKAATAAAAAAAVTATDGKGEGRERGGGSGVGGKGNERGGISGADEVVGVSSRVHAGEQQEDKGDASHDDDEDDDDDDDDDDEEEAMIGWSPFTVSRK